jgi:uncharacterized membrane-anchored protein
MAVYWRAENPQVEPLLKPTHTNMTYIEQFEQELVEKLQGSEDAATIVKWVSEKVLQSYKNGIGAGQKGAQVIRKGESRRRGFPAQAQ